MLASCCPASCVILTTRCHLFLQVFVDLLTCNTFCQEVERRGRVVAVEEEMGGGVRGGGGGSR